MYNYRLNCLLRLGVMCGLCYCGSLRNSLFLLWQVCVSIFSSPVITHSNSALILNTFFVTLFRTFFLLLAQQQSFRDESDRKKKSKRVELSLLGQSSEMCFDDDGKAEEGSRRSHSRKERKKIADEKRRKTHITRNRTR